MRNRKGLTKMKLKILCPVCKGTGKEKHKYVRNDGENVETQLTCELCKGTGNIKFFTTTKLYEYKPYEIFPTDFDDNHPF